MRVYILLAAIILSVTKVAFSQGRTINSLLKQKQTITAKYLPPTATDGKMEVLAMDFASPTVKTKPVFDTSKEQLIYKITLVYTTFRKDGGFDQPKLNKERLEELRRILPQAFMSNKIQWQFIAQTGAVDEQDAKKYFHGFVVSYFERERPSTTAELGFLCGTVNNDSLGKPEKVVRERHRFKKRRVYTGLYFPKSRTKRKEGVTYKRKWFWRKPHYNLHTETITKYDTVEVFTPSPYAYTFMHRNMDTTVLAALNRNTQWKNMLVVCDVTGSMSPYSTQVLVWHKLNFNAGRTMGYAFFNDGDNMPDGSKVVGKIGGIYLADGTVLNEVEQTAQKAMTMGSGGDAPENNIEAVLEGLKKYPKCGEVIMIADNWANIKDYSLLSKINRPIHIILCGVYGNLINTQYLDLARKTKGSIHTIEEDYTQLMDLNEGEKIDIEGKSYRIKKGKFIFVSSL